MRKNVDGEEEQYKIAFRGVAVQIFRVSEGIASMQSPRVREGL